MTLTRRRLFRAGLATASLPLMTRAARAETQTLNVLCHRVHQLCLTQGVAGDQTTAWRDANHADIAWTTLDTDPLQDRLFREASLDRTDFGVGYLVNSRATPNAASLLQPLDAYQSSAPVEDIADIAPNSDQGDDDQRQADRYSGAACDDRAVLQRNAAEPARHHGTADDA